MPQKSQSKACLTNIPQSRQMNREKLITPHKIQHLILIPKTNIQIKAKTKFKGRVGEEKLAGLENFQF